MFIRECPKCSEKINIEIYQKQQVNTKIHCKKCDARWLVPNTALKSDVEWNTLKTGFIKNIV